MKWEDSLTPGLEALQRRLAQGEHLVKIGLPDAAKETRDGIESVLDLGGTALVNEFGSQDGRIPERPAWRMALAHGSKDFNRLNAVNLRLIAVGNKTIPQALEELGMMGVAKVKTEIVEGDFVANAPSTIAKKGSSRPLVDTAQEKNSVTYEVVS